MFEGMKDMGKLLKQAKDMKSKMKSVQDGLKKLLCVGNADGVEIILTGELECKEVNINNDDLLQNKKALQNAIKKAFNIAAGKAKDAATSQLSSVTGDMKLPGM